MPRQDVLLPSLKATCSVTHPEEREGARGSQACKSAKSRLIANLTSPATSWISSFRIKLERYVSTVLGLKARRAAISLARTPSTSNENTWNSRLLRVSRG